MSLSRREIRFRAETTKPGELHRIPVSPRLLGVLEHLKTDPTGGLHHPDSFVFGDRLGRRVLDPKKAWQRCCRVAGVTDLTYHDLRHEAASRLLEAGWSLQAVSAMLGHHSTATTAIYTNVTLQGLHDAMERHGTGGLLHTVPHDAEMERRPLGPSRPARDGQAVVN